MLMTVGASCDALAQSSVSIYGIVDAATAYSSNQNGNSNIFMRSGNMAGSRIGFKGTEDLGDGLQALFILESGYETDTGTQSNASTLFSRQSYVGLADRKYGALTAGRQYTPYYQMVGAIGPSNVVTGATGAHPGDIDNLDTTIRANNSVVYTSPVWSGLQVSALYGMGEQASNKNAGRTYSAAAKYDYRDWNFALGYQNLKSAGPVAPGAPAVPAASATYGLSALNAGYTSADSVQYIAAAARYAVNSKLTLGANASNVSYRPNSSSLFRDKAVFNTGGLLAIYSPTPAWSLNAAYSYTQEKKANGISDAATYQQLSLEQAYAFTKRTSFYLLEAYQVANGNTLGKSGQQVAAVASVGDSQNTTPSSNGRQAVLMAGLRHSF